MSKETQIKYTCDRCKQDLIIPKKIFNSIPNKWKMVETKMLCVVCYYDYNIMFTNFMLGAKK